MSDINPDQERRELQRLDAQDIQQTMRWEAFKPDAVFRVKECFEKNGDLRDLLNELDLSYDEYDSLSDSEINEIVTEAVRSL